MSAPSSLHSFMAPTGLQDMNMAAITAPDDKRALLAEEDQAQWDADALRQVLEAADCKCNALVGK